MTVSTARAPQLSVLHLDDDPFELERVQTALEKHALDCTFKVTSVASILAFRKKLADGRPPDVVILDIHIDDSQTDGITLAGETRRSTPRTVILMCSTADDLSTIAEALNGGADDFISKQSDKGELSLRVFNSYRLAKLKQGGDLPANHDSRGMGERPVGATLTRVAGRVPLITQSAITAVFIRGESGTGKEVVADLFRASLPPGVPFVKVNCGALAPTLLESELFGHVKGAFTGAASDKRGLLEAASGGWIFLDEVATLSPSAQVALLRVLENQEVLRVGSTKTAPINVRVLSATNEPMEQLTASGRFRADLWQRLREAEVVLPPLRDRPAEIPALIDYFCKTMPGGPYEVSKPVLDILRSVSWREGNIRELRNCLRAMTEMHVNKLLTPLGLPERIWDELGDRPDPPAPLTPRSPEPPPSRADLEAAFGSGPLAAAARNDSLNASLNDSLTSALADGIPAVTPTSIVLPWGSPETCNYDYLADILLLAMTRALAAEHGKQSLRGLATMIGMSRSTLSGRLKSIIQRRLIDIADLSRLVGISDKADG